MRIRCFWCHDRSNLSHADGRTNFFSGDSGAARHVAISVSPSGYADEGAPAPSVPPKSHDTVPARNERYHLFNATNGSVGGSLFSRI